MIANWQSKKMIRLFVLGDPRMNWLEEQEKGFDLRQALVPI
jgi:hypothetical protein